jgi:tetratricopeptide (TPR) repeat protein
MKKIIILMTAFSLLLCSCNDVLEEHPKAVAAETFYNTEEELDAALLAPLNKMSQWNGFGMVSWGLPEDLSDMIRGTGSWEHPGEYQILDGTNIGRSDAIWRQLYMAIRDCNIPLSRLADSKVDNDVKAKYEGQFRFLRGFYYFYLVRCFNKGVLRTEENMGESDLAISDDKTLYDFIIKDLEFAADNAPDKVSLSGLPTKYAALAVLSDVYLWQKNYGKAAECAKKVIDSGNYKLVRLSKMEDFDNVFGPKLGTSSEEIFYQKFDNSTSGASSSITMFLSYPGAMPRGQAINPNGGWHGFYSKSSDPIITSWNQKDFRRQYDLYEQDLGLNIGVTYIPSKFTDPSSLSGGNDLPLVRYTDVLLNYAEAVTMSAGKPTAEAIEALNEIRRRAYGYDPKIPSEVDYKLADYNTTEKFLGILDSEEAYETYCEGKRWFYLKRRGIISEQIKKERGIDLSTNSLQFRIPESEYDYNKRVTQADQNPGY